VTRSRRAPLVDCLVVERIDHIGRRDCVEQVGFNLPLNIKVFVHGSCAARVGAEAAGDGIGVDAAQFYILEIARVVIEPHAAIEGVGQVANDILPADRETGVTDVAWAPSKSLWVTTRW